MIPPLVLGFSQVFHEAKKLLKIPGLNETSVHDNGFSSSNDIRYSNLTKLLSEYLASTPPLVDFNATLKDNHRPEISTNDSEARSAEKIMEAYSHGNAVVYIVVALFFYSLGIGLVMMTYMRKKGKEQEEYEAYQRYVSDSQEDYSRPTNNEHLANRLALQALNMVNAIPQSSHVYSKVTFV